MSRFASCCTRVSTNSCIWKGGSVTRLGVTRRSRGEYRIRCAHSHDGWQGRLSADQGYEQNPQHLTPAGVVGQRGGLPGGQVWASAPVCWADRAASRHFTSPSSSLSPSTDDATTSHSGWFPCHQRWAGDQGPARPSGPDLSSGTARRHRSSQAAAASAGHAWASSRRRSDRLEAVRRLRFGADDAKPESGRTDHRCGTDYAVLLRAGSPKGISRATSLMSTRRVKGAG
jgi:hypothetical protein